MLKHDVFKIILFIYDMYYRFAAVVWLKCIACPVGFDVECRTTLGISVRTWS